MLNFFTTWNATMIICPYLRKKESRGLLTLSSIISAAGLSMLCANLKTDKWYWKNKKVNKSTYCLLEILIHQIPLIILLKQKPKGNAWKCLIPVSIYITFVSNPYKILGIKLKNYYSLLLVCITAPIVNKFI
tara:strand:+ start:3037 stop:3432 length:396 start_codon:yes stop_codon:yes gene_type:complete